MRFILTLLLASITFSQLAAQSSVWKVSKGDNHLWLGGTCHVLRATDFPLPPEFEDAYQASKTLAFEIDPSKLEDPAVATQLMRDGMYQDGRSLKSVLSEATYAALAEQCGKSNLPIAMVDKMKPGMAVMMITMQELAKAGVAQEGVDLHFSKLAKSDQKNVVSLETVEFQLKLITDMGKGKEDELVRYSLENLDQIKAQTNSIIEAWRTGDLAALDKLMVEEMEAYPELYDSLLKDRNDRWIPKIEAMLKTAPAEFVLVGAAHMAGTDGLIAQLKAKGYTVVQEVAVK